MSPPVSRTSAAAAIPKQAEIVHCGSPEVSAQNMAKNDDTYGKAVELGKAFDDVPKTRRRC